MSPTRISPNAFRFAVSSVLAATLLAGCSAAGHGPRADVSASKAQMALVKGQAAKAIPLAEAAVQGSPRNAAYRTMLGHSYLKGGRFDSAVTAFNDAMELGDNSTRTALSLALATIAAGRNADAVALLDDWRESIPASDLGLALALAGETGRGVAILSDALRGGDNSAKLRQNLAYAYALDGRWREARLMAAQDVPADQIDARISQWAMTGKPESYRERVASLLNVPLRGDPGQPAALALSNSPSAEQLAAEAAATRPEPQLAVASAELPPVPTQADTAPEPVVAMATYTPVIAAAPAPVAAPVRASLPPRRPAPAVASQSARPVTTRVAYQAAPARSAVAARQAAPARQATPAAAGSHNVQLGSFASQQGARRAWGILASRNPELKNFRMVITPATVRGKQFWRVAAAGFDSGAASSTCSSVKARGGVCFAYATAPARATNPGAPVAGGALRARRR